MELLEFKEKFLKLLCVKEISQIGEKILDVVFTNNTDIFDNYLNLVDGEDKDWIQALWQYYEADRTEKKQDYTPISICKLVSALAGECETVYDCCGGTGALTIQILRTKKCKNVFVEELDERVIPFLLFNLCLLNTNGYVVNGDVLSRQQFKCYKISKGKKYSSCEIVEEIGKNIYDVSISNPPYNVKWNAPSPIEAMSDDRFPVLPPANNANYAFVLNCLAKSKEKVIMILPNSIANQQTEYECRKYLVDNDLIETVVIMPDKMFEATAISTTILVLNKNKKYKNEICFIDSRKNCVIEEREQRGQFGGESHTNRIYAKKYNILSDENINKILEVIENRENIIEFSSITLNKEIVENKYNLYPAKYIKFEESNTNHRKLQEIADNINYITRMQNACKLVINETIAKKLGFDVELYKQSAKLSNENSNQSIQYDVELLKEDYIQFTKNKNEFVFKCNDKELLPEIFIHFLSIWKNQISMLNTMQNNYLTELRDALLPDLMSGKLQLKEGDD